MATTAGSQDPEPLLLAVLRAAPRRYRMPPLPADAGAARAAGVETSIAFSIETARLATQHGAMPPQEVQALFTQALADWIRKALAAQGGDPAFQALVLRAHDPLVSEFVRLSLQQPVDSRAVRSVIDAVAHPGKLRKLPPGPHRDALAQLHRLAGAAEWTALRRAIEHWPAGGEHASALQALLHHPSLERLEHVAALLDKASVQRYRSLCGQAGPQQGSDAASASGRASARHGERAEQAAVHAFRELAALLNQRAAGASPYRVVSSLRQPPGFPGSAAKAKDEWDAAIVRDDSESGAANIVLLAEVKASPAAATPDFPRLLRGLQRLAHAEADRVYAFPSAAGEVRVHGASLRGLQPQGHTLPPHVIYCCPAPAETQAPVLSAASKAVLLAEPASLAFAQQVTVGASPSNADLVPVWEALIIAPRLRAALHQYETAQAVREAMLHPDDLLQAARQLMSSPSAVDPAAPA